MQHDAGTARGRSVDAAVVDELAALLAALRGLRRADASGCCRPRPREEGPGRDCSPADASPLRKCDAAVAAEDPAPAGAPPLLKRQRSLERRRVHPESALGSTSSPPLQGGGQQPEGAGPLEEEEDAWRDWAGLPAPLLERVARSESMDAAAVVAMARTCRPWRAAAGAVDEGVRMYGAAHACPWRGSGLVGLSRVAPPYGALVLAAAKEFYPPPRVAAPRA